MKTYPLKDNSAVKFLVFVLILIICVVVGHLINFDIDAYRETFRSYPIIISGAIFVGLYVWITFLIWFGPKDVFRITGAVLFGAKMSTLLVGIAELLNLIVLFILSRRLGREFVENKYKMRTKDVDKVKINASLLSIFAVRINPLIPFRLMDIAYGLSKVSFRKYFFVAVIATFPRVYWLQYILAKLGPKVLTDIPALMDYMTTNPLIVFTSVAYFGGVILLSLLAAIQAGLRRRKSHVKS